MTGRKATYKNLKPKVTYTFIDLTTEDAPITYLDLTVDATTENKQSLSYDNYGSDTEIDEPTPAAVDYETMPESEILEAVTLYATQAVYDLSMNQLIDPFLHENHTHQTLIAGAAQTAMQQIEEDQIPPQADLYKEAVAEALEFILYDSHYYHEP